MKKILSLTLAALMLVSMIPTAMAADYTEGTQITLNGSGTEYYTVTVPAAMSPGDTGIVKAEGIWNSDKFLMVSAPTTVALTYGAQSMDVDITFKPEDADMNVNGGFTLIGNSVDPVSKEVEISVADASSLFGTWTGILEYDVVLIQMGDVNLDGMITEEDAVMIQTSRVGDCELTEEQLLYADLNGDGVINVQDAAAVRLIVEGRYSANIFD